MSNKTQVAGKIASKRVLEGERPLSAEEVKTRLREQGTTLKAWAEKRGYPYGTVSQVVRGINRATFGVGHRIAVELGLK